MSGVDDQVRVDLLGLFEMELRGLEERVQPLIDRLSALRELRDRALELVDEHRDGFVTGDDLRADALARGGELELQRFLALIERVTDDADADYQSTNGIGRL